MKRLESAVAFECPSMAEGFQLVNEILSHCDLDVLEATQMAPKSFVGFLGGSATEIKSASKLKLSTTAIEWFDPLSDEVLNAVLSLNATKIEDALLVIQVASFPKILKICHQALEAAPVKISEIRTYRACAGTCCAILTGSEDKLLRIKNNLKVPQTEMAIISPLAENFRKFYDLPG